MIHTKEDLREAADRVFHNICQLLSYYSWISKISPQIKFENSVPSENLYYILVESSLVDGYLVNLRRLNEFFTKGNRERKDDLRAHHFGINEDLRFLDIEDMTELHKRIAHPTMREVQAGNIGYETYNASSSGLKSGLVFLEFLVTDFYKKGDPRISEIAKARLLLQGLMDNWTNEVESEK